MKKHPNILVILTDDHGQWAMGCAGNSELCTPSMDYLAQTGVRMVNAYTPSPVCSPARASFWTGLYPSQHGIHDWLQEKDLAKDFPALSGEKNIAEYLKENGYRCGMFGKWHCGQTDTPQPGFDRWFTNHSSQTAHKGEQVFSDEGKIISRNGFSADFLVDEALDFLREERDEPFFAFVGMIDTHSPFSNHPERFVKQYQSATFRDIPVETFSPAHGIAYRGISPDPGTHREQQIQYYAAVSMIDQQIGRLLDGLDGAGLRENTLVIYTSDHGHMNGHHGLNMKGNTTTPQNFLEESIRVPCLLNWPGVLPEGVEKDAWVNHCDLFKTLLEVSETDPGEINSPGKSYWPLLQEHDESTWKDRAAISEYGNARMIRKGNYKYIRRYAPDTAHGDELYDLAEDPREDCNLLADDAQHPALSELNADLEKFFEKYEVKERSGLRVMETASINVDEPWRRPKR